MLKHLYQYAAVSTSTKEMMEAGGPPNCSCIVFKDGWTPKYNLKGKGGPNPPTEAATYNRTNGTKYYVWCVDKETYQQMKPILLHDNFNRVYIGYKGLNRVQKKLYNKDIETQITNVTPESDSDTANGSMKESST